MDYASIEECDPKVEISVLTPEEIQRTIDARMRIWRRLLNGEEKRWSSIEQLIKLYQDAASQRIAAAPLNALWDGGRETYEHHLVALRNG